MTDFILIDKGAVVVVFTNTARARGFLAECGVQIPVGHVMEMPADVTQDFITDIEAAKLNYLIAVFKQGTKH